MSDPHVCPLILGFCKRGHPRTKQTTFERKVHINGKDYIARECRICHSLRNVRNAGRDKTGRKNNSKWLRFMESGA
jgi:hypothetical protein